MLLILMLKMAGDRMLPCRTPHLLLVQLGKSGTHSNPERTFPQEALNKPGEMAPETKIPEVRQNAVLPPCVINYLKVKENG